MGEITYQGESPFRVLQTQAASARFANRSVEMIVYASVAGSSPDAFQIQIPMSSQDARRLAAQLTASAAVAEMEQRRR